MPARKLVLAPSFERSYKKFTKRNQSLKESIAKSLELLGKDAFSTQLKTHKLSGNLYGLLACSCGYDCRIVFSVEKEKNEEVILLLDIATHDEVY